MRIKGWFGPKRDGYGAGPRSWEGWMATAVFTVAIIADARWFQPQQFGLPLWAHPVSTAALGVFFLLLIWLTYYPDA